MRDEGRRQRAAEIEDVALAMLSERGYAGMSMLAVARAAKASNETLYRWYGDKLGLFRAIVERNAETVRQALDAAMKSGAGHDQVRMVLGPLLTMVTSERAVALNRAAAADVSGELGRAIAAGGREAVLKRMVGALERAGVAEPDRAADMLLRLLIGDWQVRRVIGAMAEPAEEDVATRVAEAWKAFTVLYELTKC